MHARLDGARQAGTRPGSDAGIPSGGYAHNSLNPMPVRYVSVPAGSWPPCRTDSHGQRPRNASDLRRRDHLA